jgi:hypothetical protein
MALARWFPWLRNTPSVVSSFRPTLEELENRLVLTLSISPIPSQVVIENHSLTIPFVAKTDDEGALLVFFLEGSQPGAVIDPGYGVFTWTAPSVTQPTIFPFEVDVIDFNTFEIAKLDFNVEVDPTAPPPAAKTGPLVNPAVVEILDQCEPEEPEQPVVFNPVSTTPPTQPPLPPPVAQFAPPTTTNPTENFLANAAFKNLGPPLETPLDPLPPQSLKVSNTEGNSDGSSVERLYQDFLGPAATQPPPGGAGAAADPVPNPLSTPEGKRVDDVDQKPTEQVQDNPRQNQTTAVTSTDTDEVKPVSRDGVPTEGSAAVPDAPDEVSNGVLVGEQK